MLQKRDHVWNEVSGGRFAITTRTWKKKKGGKVLFLTGKGS